MAERGVSRWATREERIGFAMRHFQRNLRTARFRLDAAEAWVAAMLVVVEGPKAKKPFGKPVKKKAAPRG